MPVAEVDTTYAAREEGSVSKLRTVRDAVRILAALGLLFKEIHPARFFGVIGAALVLLAVALAMPVFETYATTGAVPRLPTAVLATGLVLLAGISTVSGLILDSVARGRLEQKRLVYLAMRAVGRDDVTPTGLRNGETAALGVKR
jgi:hypothetical protein